MQLKGKNIFSSLLILILFLGCQSNSTKTNNWVNSLKKGEHLATLKENTPDYVLIDWSKPVIVNDSLIRYDANYKDRSDFRPITYYIFFQDSLFVSYGGNN